MVMRPVFNFSGPKAPMPGTSSRCQATPAPPAAWVEMNGTSVRVTANSPEAVVPMTWMVAIPRNVATPSVT
jgi:hypothetical protein